MISLVALKFLWRCLKETALAFGKNNLMVRSAALSYYTIFSLPPLLLILMQTTSVFFDQETIRKTIFSQLADAFGDRGVQQLSATVENIGLYDQEGWSLLLGVAGILFTSTTIFVSIQAAMNAIFNAQEASSKMGWWQYLRGRMVALFLVFSVAFVLVVSLVVNAVLARFTAYLSAYVPDLSTALLYLFSLVFPLFITGGFFALMFKYLPDRPIDWSTARLGAVITTLLFFLGQYAITFYIALSNTGNLYEAAGSVIAIMAWIFYASAIFYFGAQFTAIYSQNLGDGNKVEQEAEDTDLGEPKKYVHHNVDVY